MKIKEKLSGFYNSLLSHHSKLVTIFVLISIPVIIRILYELLLNCPYIYDLGRTSVIPTYCADFTNFYKWYAFPFGEFFPFFHVGYSLVSIYIVVVYILDIMARRALLSSKRFVLCTAKIILLVIFVVLTNIYLYGMYFETFFNTSHDVRLEIGPDEYSEGPTGEVPGGSSINESSYFR